MRYHRENMFMDMARAASKRSTCCRLNVGSLVVCANNPISVGYNGAKSGEPHCLGNDCPGMVPGNCPAIHAEANALRKAGELLPAGTDVDLYLTHSPCSPCSLLVINSDLWVRRIFFEIPYRSTQHLGMFQSPYTKPHDPGRSGRTEVYEVTPAGYIVEYFSRRVVELP